MHAYSIFRVIHLIDCLCLSKAACRIHWALLGDAAAGGSGRWAARSPVASRGSHSGRSECSRAVWSVSSWDSWPALWLSWPSATPTSLTRRTSRDGSATASRRNCESSHHFVHVYSLFQLINIEWNDLLIYYRRHGLLHSNEERLEAFDRRELDALRARGELPPPETLPLPDTQFPLIRRGLNRLESLFANVFGSQPQRTATTSTSIEPSAVNAADAKNDRN